MKSSVHMSCDSQSTSRIKFNWKWSWNLDWHSKIFEKNWMLIWSAWLVSESKMMQLFCNNHKPKEATEESILEFIIEFYERAWKKQKSFEWENHFLIFFDKNLFYYESYLVHEVKDFAAIWSWMWFALAAMYLWKWTSEACEVASKFDLYCSWKIEYHSVKVNPYKKKQ